MDTERTSKALEKERLAPGGPAELRTFLIADIRGYTAYTQDHGDEAAVQLAATFASVVREVVGEHRGEVVELRGDEALCAFASAREAVRAAIALQIRLSSVALETALPLNVGMGIDAGEAMPFEGGYRGGALNMAARLCSRAGPGEVLVSETLVGLVRKIDGLRYVERGYEQLKGFGEPVRVLQVEADEQDGSRDGKLPDGSAGEVDSAGNEQNLPTGGFVGSLPASPLVARRDELDMVAAVVSAVQEGSSRLVFLSGEPGAGKTRLAQEVTADLHRRRFLLGTGTCREARLSTPFYPFLEVLGQLYAASPSVIRKELPRQWPHLARLLPDQNLPLPPPGPGGQDQERLFWSISGFLQALARTTPIGILIDDLHWADGSTLELIQHLARQVRTSKVLILGTYRDVDLGRNKELAAAVRDLTRQDLLDEVPVASLNEPDTGTFVAEMLGHQQPPEEFVSLIYRHTEGNPFFIQQVVRVLLDRGDVRPESGTWDCRNVREVDVPETVRSVVGQRLAYLSEGTQDLLRQASVIGQVFSFSELEAISEHTEEEIDAGIEEARRAGVLRSLTEDSYSFDHALTQQVLYGDISTRRKRRLHLAIGETLENRAKTTSDNEASEIAWHFLRAAERGRALGHLLKAGDQAIEVFANHQAEQHYRAVLEIAREVGNSELEAEALEKLGRVLRTQARYEQALEALEAAAELARNDDRQEDEMRLLAQIGLTHAERGTLKEGSERLESFLTSVSSSQPTASLGALYSALARLYYFEGRAKESLDAADLGSSMASSAGDEALLAQADTRRGAALYTLGRVEEAIRTLEGAMAVAQSFGDLETVCRALHSLASSYMVKGDLKRSLEYRHQMLRVGQQIGDNGQVIFAKSYLGLTLGYLGDWDEAVEWLRSASNLSGDMGSSWYASYGGSFLAYFEFLRGTESNPESDPHTASDDPHLKNTFLQALLSEREILSGQPQLAIQRLQPLSFTDDLSSPLVLANLAWAQLELGLNQAERTALIAVAQAKKYTHVQHFVDALRVRGMVFRRNGRPDKAEVDLQVVSSLARRIPYVLSEGRALLEWGLVLKDKGNAAQAEEKLRQSLKIFQRLGTPVYTEMAQRALSEGVKT